MGYLALIQRGNHRPQCRCSSLGQPGRVGFGGVLRDGEGNWIQGCYGNIGKFDCLKPELAGLLHGLDRAWSKGVSHLVCYSDSTIALELVVVLSPPFHSYTSLIREVQEHLHRPWHVRLLNTWWEGNFAADFMAKAGAWSDQCLMLFDTFRHRACVFCPFSLLSFSFFSLLYQKKIWSLQNSELVWILNLDFFYI